MLGERLLSGDHSSQLEKKNGQQSTLDRFVIGEVKRLAYIIAYGNECVIVS